MTNEKLKETMDKIKKFTPETIDLQKGVRTMCAMSKAAYETLSPKQKEQVRELIKKHDEEAQR